MFRCRLGEVPNDLEIQFRLSGRLGIQAVIPPLSRSRSRRAQTKYDESFAAIGLRLWNVLPAEISMMDCPRTFKRVLTGWCLIGLRLPVTDFQKIIAYCRSFGCLFRLVQNWRSLSICGQTFLSKRGEGFKDVEVPLLKNQQSSNSQPLPVCCNLP